MAGPTDRMIFSEQQWFDASNPGPLHDALRADYARTRSRALQRPSLRRHMEACAECQALGAATATAPSPLSTRKRLKLVLDKSRMHRLLNLPDNFEIVHMFAENDPNIVSIIVAGEGLPAVDDFTETPIARLDDVERGTTATAS